MDVVNLKISKLGGLTKTRQARDLCVSLGIAMTLEDSWGGDITTAAIAHLAHSTPPEFLFTATDFNSYVTVSTADGRPRRHNGRMAASTAPGLGITPRMDVLRQAARVGRLRRVHRGASGVRSADSPDGDPRRIPARPLRLVPRTTCQGTVMMYMTNVLCQSPTTDIPCCGG